jgi:hypothetical protein
MSVDPASQHAGGYGQTAAPVAMTDTGYQNAAQPGPSVNPSPQWVANTQGAPAGPDLPGVQWQVPHQAPPPQPMQTWSGPPPALYAGPGQPQYAAYGAPPQIVYGWYGDAGWQYKLMSDNTIYATGSSNNTTYTDKPLAPGSAGHKAVVEEWLRLHAAQISTPIGQKFLQMRAGGEPGLVSSVVGALRDAASTLTGGMVAPAVTSAPQAPQQTPMVQVQTPQGPMMMQAAPAPVPATQNRGLMIAGGVLLALAAAGGAYWMFADSPKKSEAKGE